MLLASLAGGPSHLAAAAAAHGVAAMMPDGQEMNQDGMKVGSMFHFQACLQFIITDQ
jgi:hypothetical protein